MRNHWLLLCLLLLPIVGDSQQSQTQPVNVGRSGNDFLAQCDSSDTGSWKQGFCRGYIMGIADGIQLLSTTTTCPPEHMTAGQFYRIVVKYIHDHPERTDKLTVILASEAWTASFACPVKK
jgi:hypothetical protein